MSTRKTNGNYMVYNQHLGKWRVVFKTSLFLEIGLGLGKREYTLQKKITIAYIPKPEKRYYTLQKLMTRSISELYTKH